MIELIVKLRTVGNTLTELTLERQELEKKLTEHFKGFLLQTPRAWIRPSVIFRLNMPYWKKTSPRSHANSEI